MSDGQHRLPRLYVELMHAVAQSRGDARQVWLGDVGFYMHNDDDQSRWSDALASRRWRGMHPDLVPFAEDGFGNRFCFYRSARDGCRVNRSIVYWMYETYRAVPVASGFAGFLAWLQLSAYVAARRGDPVIDRRHVDEEIAPLMDALGCALDVAAALDEPDPAPVDVHRAHLRVDPHAPGPAVSLAAYLGDHDAELEALDLCAEATFSFPEFAAARLVAGRLHQRAGDSAHAAEAYMQTLLRPLVYGGDPQMNGFRRLPEVDATQVVERLLALPDVPDSVIDSPIWTMARRDDPRSPRAWLQLAGEYAMESDLETAVVMATNALYLGVASELLPGIEGLLAELYGALEWDWHHRVAAPGNPQAQG